MKAGRELEGAYEATDFVVENGAKSIVIRIGRKSDEIDRMLAARKMDSWAFITAFNPRSEQLTENENSSRHHQLLTLISARGYEFMDGYGIGSSGNWPSERSLFIFSIDREVATMIGKQFGQNAIVAGRFGEVPELVWCD